jgi:hypothetical protein
VTVNWLRVWRKSGGLTLPFGAEQGFGVLKPTQCLADAETGLVAVGQVALQIHAGITQFIAGAFEEDLAGGSDGLLKDAPFVLPRSALLLRPEENADGEHDADDAHQPTQPVNDARRLWRGRGGWRWGGHF